MYVCVYIICTYILYVVISLNALFSIVCSDRRE